MRVQAGRIGPIEAIFKGSYEVFGLADTLVFSEKGVYPYYTSPRTLVFKYSQLLVRRQVSGRKISVCLEQGANGSYQN